MNTPHTHNGRTAHDLVMDAAFRVADRRALKALREDADYRDDERRKADRRKGNNGEEKQ